MKKLLFLLLPALLLPGLAFAKSDPCEMREETVDPATQEKTIKTKWVKLSHSVNYMNLSAGKVSGVSVGDEKFLEVSIPNTTSYVFPTEFETGSGRTLELGDATILKDEKKYYVFKETGEKVEYIDAMLFFHSKLQQIPIVVPAGSSLRITLEDRTEVVLETVQEFKAASRDVKVSLPHSKGNNSSFFRAKTNLELRYALDADAIASLTGQPIMNMRLATATQYFLFGRSNLDWDDPRLTKKTKSNVQKVLQCVL